MKRIALALVPVIAAACLSVGACTPLPTLNLSNQVNLNTLEGVVSGYGLVINAENVLHQQPLCLTGTSPSITNICVKRSLIVRLQGSDKIANTAVNQAVTFVNNNPTVSPTQYISAAQAALLASQTIVNSATQGAN